MNERINRELKRNAFLFLSFLFFTMICFSSRIKAQGWSFTFQLAQSGPCPSGGPQIILPTFPNLGLPSQSQCESLRQQILAVRQSFAVYDGSNYLGECAIFYTCTPCTGSDYSGTSNQALISLDGYLNGTAFFSGSEYGALRDWWKQFSQRQNALGKEDVNNLNRNTSGDDDLDKMLQKDNFRIENPEQGGVVDLRPSKEVDDFLKKKVMIPGDNSVYENQVENTHHVKLESVVPPLPNAPDGVREIHDNVDRNIETARDWTIATLGLLPDALNEFVFPAILLTDVLAADATVINDCFIRNPPNCPSSEAVATRIAINLTVDGAGAAFGNFAHGYAPVNNQIGKEGVENILKLSEFSGDRLMGIFGKPADENTW